MTRTRHEGQGFRLEIEDRPGYLRAYVSGGTDSLQVSLAYWSLIWAECERRGCDKVLVVEDLTPSHIEESDLQALVTAMVEFGFRRVRIAFVSLQSPEQLNEHGAILGAEMGLTATVFTDERFAERWLRFAH